MKEKRIAAIDLHGTLLNSNWEISKEQNSSLIKLLTKLSASIDFYICTGNDVSFLEQQLAKELLTCFKGYILETGCTLYTNNTITNLTEEKTVTLIKELEALIKRENYNYIKYFAKRHTTISIFTKDENGGVNPEILYPQICDFISKEQYSKDVYVTYSDVAVDIVPQANNKYTGIKKIANNKEIIAVADSYNDVELLAYSDYVFLPANYSSSLKDTAVFKRTAVAIDDAGTLTKDKVYISSKPNTDAVIEILSFIQKTINE